MDRLIKRFDYEQDRDLAVVEKRGVAYARPMVKTASYDFRYQEKVMAYEDSPIARAVNAGRVDLLRRHAALGAKVLDWGCGSGAFMRVAGAAGFDAYGYDVNPAAQLTLGDRALGNPDLADAVTLWDTIEHMEVPEVILKRVRTGAHLFVSLPIFDDLKRVRESKHYRPGEHLYYWTRDGFVSWMALYGYRLLEESDHETSAGRESIGAFAFKKDLPNYFDHIVAYNEIHSSKHYGASATDEYLDVAAAVVREVKPSSILDYGCGRSDLAAHFWLDGKRKIAKYDPAIPQTKLMPEGRFDLTFCCDVMEHIPMLGVDRVFAEIRDKSSVVLFAISTILARAKLPDGRNAHVTILTKSEWLRWIKDEFGPARVLKGKHDHELVVLAGVA